MNQTNICGELQEEKVSDGEANLQQSLSKLSKPTTQNLLASRLNPRVKQCEILDLPHKMHNKIVPCILFSQIITTDTSL